MTTRIRLHRGMQRGLWGARAGVLLAASMLVGSACATGTSSMAPGASSTPSAPGASSTPSAPGASGSPSTPVVFVTTGTLVEARMWHAASRLRRVRLRRAEWSASVAHGHFLVWLPAHVPSVRIDALAADGRLLQRLEDPNGVEFTR